MEITLRKTGEKRGFWWIRRSGDGSWRRVVILRSGFDWRLWLRPKRRLRYLKDLVFFAESNVICYARRIIRPAISVNEPGLSIFTTDLIDGTWLRLSYRCFDMLISILLIRTNRIKLAMSMLSLTILRINRQIPRSPIKTTPLLDNICTDSIWTLFFAFHILFLLYIFMVWSSIDICFLSWLLILQFIVIIRGW